MSTINEFLKAINGPYENAIGDFVRHFDEEKFELILKLINNEQMTESEMTMALNKYRFDIDMQGVLVSAPQIPSEIKKNVVRDFICESILNPEKERPNEHWFIEMVIKNYKEIEPKELNSLCEHFYEDVINLFNWYDEENQKGIPQTTADIVILNEFALLTCETHRKYYMANYPPLSFISENDTLDYILENMPENAQLAEKIATSIINSPKVSDATKDMLFEKYGCNPEFLVMITPHISNTLYDSIVDGAYADNVHKASGDDVTKIYQARYIINYLLRKNLMSEAQQIDVVNRVLSNAKEVGDRSSNDTIELLATKTTSPAVLHAILKSSAHINDKNKACGNENVLKEDVQSHVHIYVEKIRKKLDAGKYNEISDKWLYLARAMLKRFELKKEDYETLLRAGHADTVNAILSSQYTPQDVVKQATEMVYKKAENDISGGWRNMKLKSIVNRKLFEVGLYENKHIESLSHLLVSMITHCRKDVDFDDMIYHSKYWKQNIEYMPTMKSLMIEALNELGHKPQNATREEFIRKSFKYLDKLFNETIIESRVDPPIKDMTTSQLSRERMRHVEKALTLIKNNDIIELYPFINNIKDRFVLVVKEEADRFGQNLVEER